MRHIEATRKLVVAGYGLGTAPARLAWRFGRATAAKAVDFLEENSPYERHISERLQRTMPAHNARIGAAAIRHAKRCGDPSLKALGHALIARNLTIAARDPTVPTEVAEDVLRTYRECGTDPRKNPLVDELTAQAAIKIDQTFHRGE